MNSSNIFHYQVAVDAPVGNGVFTYNSDMLFQRGDVVSVPFGLNSFRDGIIVEQLSELPKESESFVIKNIVAQIEAWAVTEVELKLYQWVARYYHYPLGKLIFDCLPNREEFVQKNKTNLALMGKGDPIDWRLSLKHQAMVASLVAEISKGWGQFLIHGVTGSGKSLIFLEYIKSVLLLNKSVLYLVPEINLTPQFIEFFSKYLNCEIMYFHSEVSNKLKFDLFKRLRGTELPRLVIAARSGVFLHANWGAIIIDEEHDHSYKQEDRCRYQARDVALVKAKLYNIPVLLGSATPALETYYRFQQPMLRHHYFALPERFNNYSLPQIKSLPEPAQKEATWPFHPELVAEIKKVIAQNGQILILVNKLGFARFMSCQNCHYSFSCPACSVKLTYFKNKNKLQCHICEYTVAVPRKCPECSCLDLWSHGYGTERVHQKLADLLPQVVMERFDREVVKSFKELKNRIERFHQQESKILVGTQMLSKGHNFKNVKLVAVLGIDSYLHFPDFRAKEKIFQLLTQVAGRAGRFGQDSLVYVQTSMPSEEVRLLTNGDLDEFYQQELKMRAAIHYPPFSNIALLTFKSTNSKKSLQVAEIIAEQLHITIAKYGLQIDCKGPKKTNLEKSKNEYGQVIMLKAKEKEPLYKIINSISLPTGTVGVKFTVDVDPQSME